MNVIGNEGYEFEDSHWIGEFTHFSSDVLEVIRDDNYTRDLCSQTLAVAVQNDPPYTSSYAVGEWTALPDPSALEPRPEQCRVNLTGLPVGSNVYMLLPVYPDSTNYTSLARLMRKQTRYVAESFVDLNDQNSAEVIHRLEFDAYPTFGCCAGYTLKAPETAAVCGLPASKSVYQRTIQKTSVRFVDVAEIPCVMNAQSLRVPTNETESPTVPAAQSQTVTISGRTAVITPTVWEIPILVFIIVGYLLVLFIFVWMEVRWRSPEPLRIRSKKQ